MDQNQKPEGSAIFKFSKSIPVFISAAALSIAGFACGGSDDSEEDDGTPVNPVSAVTAETVPEGFVFIPGGQFKLTHKTHDYKKGQTLTLNAFALGKTPVTVAQYKKCVEAGACTVTDDESSYGYYGNYRRNKLNHPMNYATHADAKKYCEWIGGRLPMEEEWEYAATHNGTQSLNTTNPCGDETPAHCEKANYSVLGERDSPDSIPVLSCEGKTESRGMEISEVGNYSPAGDSPVGLVDMIGNIWEWTSSKWEISSEAFILKGCSFDSVVREKVDCSVADRIPGDPDELLDTNGFRCAM